MSCAVEAWIVRVATNAALDVYRRDRRVAARTDRPGRIDDHRFAEGPLAAALGALPRRPRQVVALRYLADLSEGQAADGLGLSVGSGRTHLRRGMAALRSSFHLPIECSLGRLTARHEGLPPRGRTHRADRGARQLGHHGVRPTGRSFQPRPDDG